MHKTVAQIISGARIHLRRPSEQELANEDMRFILHQLLESLISKSIQKNVEFFTESELVEFTYDDEMMAHDIALTISDRVEFYPVHLYHQPSSDDPDTGDWARVNLVKLAQFPVESLSGSPVGCFLDTFRTDRGVKIRFNLTDDYIQTRRWRLDYRLFPTDVLEYTDTVPFPAEFSNLLEYMLAAQAIQLVQRSSPDWQTFKQTQSTMLEARAMKREAEFDDWLDGDIENVVVTPAPFHYLRNNPQLRRLRRPFKVDPV